MLINTNNYSFKIFNRYGVVVYATNKPRDGWHGNINAAQDVTGNYQWKLQFTNPNNKKPVMQYGSFTQLR